MIDEQQTTRLGERLEVPIDEARLTQGWRAIAERTYEPAPSRRRLYAGAGVVTLAAAAALLFITVGPNGTSQIEPGSVRPGPLATVAAGDGARVGLEEAMRAASASGASVPLDDGSMIAIAPGATLEPLENSGERFSLLLREGRAHFDVRPGGPRRWTIEAGLVSVEVVGTAFEVVRGDDGVSVRVERGRVLVRGDAVPDRVRSLGAGESIRVGAEIVEAPAPDAPSAATEPVREPALASETPRVRRRAPESVAVATLLEEADEARRAGRVDEALELYAAAARRDGDPQAGLASLTRGRLALDHGRAAEAVGDLRRAIAAGLPPALEETARARLVDALARNGDREGAVREADEYARRYPDGAWRGSVSRAIGE